MLDYTNLIEALSEVESRIAARDLQERETDTWEPDVDLLGDLLRERRLEIEDQSAPAPQLSPSQTNGSKPPSPPDLQPAQEGNGQITHNKAMASTFLTGLDPTTTRFTFQTFDDNKDRKSKALAQVLHGTLDEVWPKILALNTPAVGAGIFITLNETDFRGRSTKNIVRARALFYDADGDEQVTHATTVIEAHDAIPSITVNSGGGRHGYYICDGIPLEQFTTLQKSLIAKLGTDPNPKDLPRVMRLPGTLHLKDPTTPRLVKLLQTNGAVWQLSDLIAKLGLSATAPDRINGGGAADGHKIEIAEAFKGLDPNKNVAAGIVIEEIPPLPFDPIKAECGWLREAHETGGRAFDNPQWNLTTLIATSLQDGHDLAHEFGNKHPDYTFEETEEEWERKNRERRAKNIGWPQCKTISENGGKPHCSKCPHFAKGKSPLNLGYEAAKDESDSEELRQLGGTRPPELRLPEEFCLNKDGIVCAFIPSKTVKGKVVKGGLLPLLMVKIKDPSLQFQNGYFGVGFVAATDRTGEQQIFLNSANVYAPGLFTELAKRCVLFCPDKLARTHMEVFAVSWLKKLLDEDDAIRDSGTMGWRYKDGNLIGFVYGDALHHENGTTIQIVAGADDELRKWYAPVGKRETWVRAARLLTDRKRPELDCLIAIAFAAPLMVFTGATYGAILSVWGDPGTSKSTAQQVAAAVWGHPKQTRESLNSTPKSVQGRLGRTRNLAAYWDDVQDERHQEGLFQTMFVAAEGTEGGRLNPDASYKQRLDWQTMLVACSNASFVEYLIKKQRSTTAGMRRVFEFEFNKEDGEPGMINALDASTIFAELEHNYGGIGLEYARMLAQEHKDIKTLVSGILNEFTETVAGVGDESFWLSTCGCLLAGATLANRLGAELDVPAMRAFLIDAYHYNRKIRGAEGTEGGSLANTEQSLAAFLNFYKGGGNAIFIDKLFANPKIKVRVLLEPETSRPLYMQVVRDQRLIIVSKREMRDFFGKREIQARQVFDGLVKYFNAKEIRHTLGAGTAHGQAQEVCYEIPVRDHQPLLYDLLVACGKPTSEA